MYGQLRFLLLQMRNADDPMKPQEVDCFARALQCPRDAIDVFDLLAGSPPEGILKRVDVVLLGGSGHYSVAVRGPWWPAAMETMQWLYHHNKATFASCWGFQAMAQALGGRVVTDRQRAELGSLPVRLTEAGQQDPVFGILPRTFLALHGHQDVVDVLPPGATLLAVTDKTPHQAFTFPGKPIYCTQFHPELDRKSYLQRLDTYPEYVERILGISLDEFAASVRETPHANQLLVRFLEVVFG